MNRRQAITVLAGAGTAVATAPIAPVVHLRRVPDGGLQPQAVMDERGKLHLLYYTGDAHEGNLGYTHSANGGVSFSAAIPVNSQPGSAIAAGTIRGAQMAIGREGRVHVAWNGSGAKPPMLYTRLNGNGFDPQRNLMTQPSHLDGGGSIAADGAGNVYVTWHNGEGEANRSVWVAKSRDDGRTFTAEQKASTEPAGACGCCGMKSFVSRDGGIYIIYRSATEGVHRDIHLLRSSDGGQHFTGRLVHKWDINACPMTSMDTAESGGGVVGTWETAGQVFWSKLDSLNPSAAGGEGKGRKHPRLAFNKRGEMLLVWTEGTGWQRGGTLAWQVYDRSGYPLDGPKSSPGIATWSFAAPIANTDGTFSILH